MTEKGSTAKPDYAAFLEGARVLAKQVQGLQATAVAQYTPAVEALLVTGSHNIQDIERTLDGLLDFCGHPPALELYRRLCRHYFKIDPVATASYINVYRERWDADEAEADE